MANARCKDEPQETIIRQQVQVCMLGCALPKQCVLAVSKSVSRLCADGSTSRESGNDLGENRLHTAWVDLLFGIVSTFSSGLQGYRGLQRQLAECAKLEARVMETEDSTGEGADATGPRPTDTQCRKRGSPGCEVGRRRVPQPQTKPTHVEQLGGEHIKPGGNAK